MAIPNFPIETEEAQRFWGSHHLLNQAKAVIAFSTDESNANDNMRRRGISYFRRQWYLRNYKQYVNNPSMVDIPFSPVDPEIPWWKELTVD